MIYVGAATSGANYNPAVTVGLMITGQLAFFTAICYLIAQTVGSIIAGIMLRYLLPGEFLKLGSLGYPRVNPHSA